MKYDIDLTENEWADLIDYAKKREAFGDLSMIAYRLLITLITTKELLRKGKEATP